MRGFCCCEVSEYKNACDGSLVYFENDVSVCYNLYFILHI